ncbi:uncharacterized protein RSE6_09076 [Rhynchosporium secalis]|uniref:Uncharacterized protein n=1 Tax=Rhynchosporium secalis TaxID=38038 RepID=A0A1E1MH40_RHYSE|nr:uncharacterized protein RSE6_09076 [Rhynchosporium secalis]
MGGLGSLSVGVEFGIVFGCLIGAACIAGLTKLAWSKRKLRKNMTRAELETSLRSDQEKRVPWAVEGVDLFRGQTIEQGHFNEASRTRPSSPSPSYVLSPNTLVVDWKNSEKPAGQSASSSSNLLSRSLAPSCLNYTKRKPSPSGLQPPKVDTSLVDGICGSYLPLPSPRSSKSFSEILSMTGVFDEVDSPSWVSPLDVHYSRPSTPRVRPTSYLPKLQFPGEIEEIGQFIPSPSSSVRHTKSESSIVSAVTPLATPPPVLQLLRGAKSPVLSDFPLKPHYLPSRGSRGGARSLFPANDDQIQASPRRGAKKPQESPHSVSLNDLGPQTVSVGQFDFPQGMRDWSPSSFEQSPPKNAHWDPTSPAFPGPIHSNDGFSSPEPEIRDAAINIQHVPISRPSHLWKSSAETFELKRSHTSATSSVYGTSTSILDYNKGTTPSFDSRPRSRSTSATPKVDNQTRSASNLKIETDSSSSHSAAEIAIRCIVIRHQAIAADQGPFKTAALIPTTHANLHSGIPTKSVILPTQTPPVPQVFSVTSQPALPFLEQMSGKLKTVNETAQISVGDFYDAYYQRSVLGQRARAASLAAQRVRTS